MKRSLFVLLSVLILFPFVPGQLFAQSFAMKSNHNSNNKFSVNSLYNQQTGRSKAKKPLIIVGAAVLGGVYVASLVIDRAYESDVIFDELYIPVIGPFLAIANYDDHVDPSYSGADFDKSLFLISGILQTAGAVLLITGLSKSYTPDSNIYKTREFFTKFSIAPMQRKGLSASYRFNF